MGTPNWLQLSSTLIDQLTDADNDTKIQVEETADEDIIRFDIAGTEYFTMRTGRLETFNTGGSVFIGEDAGASDDLTSNFNVFVGAFAGQANTSGNNNVTLGRTSLQNNISGSWNTVLGSAAMTSNTLGNLNTALGYASLNNNSTGSRNITIGPLAMQFNTEGRENIAIGSDALLTNIAGNKNVAIGRYAGQYVFGSNSVYLGYKAGAGSSSHSKSANIFIGYEAGINETTGNKLYIENTSSSTPLIFGDFANDLININGNLGVGTTSFGNGTRTLALQNGTIPIFSITDGVLLYSQDVSSSSELKVRDEAGNITTLSPHNFSMTHKSEPMAWSYYSENAEVGKKINVDMLKTVRLIEKITGDKLVYVNEIDADNIVTESNNTTTGILQQQQNEIENLKEQIATLLLRLEKVENLKE